MERKKEKMTDVNGHKIIKLCMLNTFDSAYWNWNSLDLDLNLDHLHMLPSFKLQFN